MSLKEEFVITLYTENQIGILNRIAILFSRRRINIEALNLAPSEVTGIHRFTIVITETREAVRKLSLQLDKQVDVLKAFYHTEHEVRWVELALYKVKKGDPDSAVKVELLQKHGIRRVETENADFILFETTGSAENTLAVLNDFKSVGLIEFTKSAKIAVAKKGVWIHKNLLEFADLQS